MSTAGAHNVCSCHLKAGRRAAVVRFCELAPSPPRGRVVGHSSAVRQRAQRSTAAAGAHRVEASRCCAPGRPVSATRSGGSAAVSAFAAFVAARAPPAGDGGAAREAGPRRPRRDIEPCGTGARAHSEAGQVRARLSWKCGVKHFIGRARCAALPRAEAPAGERSRDVTAACAPLPRVHSVKGRVLVSVHGRAGTLLLSRRSAASALAGYAAHVRASTCLASTRRPRRTAGRHSN